MMKGQKGYVQVMSHDSWLERALRSVLEHVLRWYELHRQRRLLAQLSDEALKDIGLSRADVFQESERPFWNDPMKR